MHSTSHESGNQLVGRQFEYEDSYVVCLDLPFSDETVSVDVVGTTAIVVADAEGEQAQTEFDLPGTAETIDVNNGVVTITIQK